MKTNKFIAASLFAASISSTQFSQAASGVKEVGDIITDAVSIPNLLNLKDL